MEALCRVYFINLSLGLCVVSIDNILFNYVFSPHGNESTSHVERKRKEARLLCSRHYSCMCSFPHRKLQNADPVFETMIQFVVCNTSYDVS